MLKEYAFEMAASAIRFGAGVTREVGSDLADIGAQHVLVFTDPNLRNLPPVVTTLESLEHNKIRFTVFDQVRVEPTEESLQAAIRFASEGDYDAFVAVGGGSTIDTAKAANLYSCWPADFLDYVNPPIGKGKPVPGPVKPLLAIPTTADIPALVEGTLPQHRVTKLSPRPADPEDLARLFEDAMRYW